LGKFENRQNGSHGEKLMEGKGIERPSTVAATDETFKKAPESKKKHGEQPALGL